MPVRQVSTVYTAPKRPAREHHDDPARAEQEFRDRLIAAINEDPRVRAAILRLFASQRARRTTTQSRTRRER